MVWMAPLWIALTFGQSGQSEEKPTKALPGIDTVWLEKLKEQGPKEIEAYKKAIENLEEESELSATVPVKKGGPLQSKVVRVKSFYDGDFYRVEKTNIVDGEFNKSITEVFCQNSVYRFGLMKDGLEKPWIVIKFSREKEKGGPGAFLLNGQGGLSKVLQALESKGPMVLSRLQWVEEKKLLLASLKSKTEEVAGQEAFEQEIWLDSENHWCVVESINRSPTGGTSEKTTYGQMVDGLPFPTRIENYEWKEPQTLPRLRAEINLKVRKNLLPRSGFYLAAFGLPEPAESEEQAGRFRMPGISWLLGGTVLCLVFGLGLWFLNPRGAA